MMQNNETPGLENETETKNLCKRGCGFYGSVQFKDMCSKCYQEQSKCDPTMQSAPIVCSNSVDVSNGRTSSQCSECQETTSNNYPCLDKGENATSDILLLSRSHKRKLDLSSESSEPHTAPVNSQSTYRINRCAWCRKRVGLTGFRCRCDGLFCSLHRYSDQHKCDYDYRANGRLELARANPEVRCPKIRKL